MPSWINYDNIRSWGKVHLTVAMGNSFVFHFLTSTCSSFPLCWASFILSVRSFRYEYIMACNHFTRLLNRTYLNLIHHHLSIHLPTEFCFLVLPSSAHPLCSSLAMCLWPKASRTSQRARTWESEKLTFECRSFCVSFCEELQTNIEKLLNCNQNSYPMQMGIWNSDATLEGIPSWEWHFSISLDKHTHMCIYHKKKYIDIPWHTIIYIYIIICHISVCVLTINL